MPPEKVAMVMGYEVPEEMDEFRADFSRELAIGQAVYRAKVIDQLDKQMAVGMVGATNKLEALTRSPRPGTNRNRRAPGTWARRWPPRRRRARRHRLVGSLRRAQHRSWPLWVDSACPRRAGFVKRGVVYCMP
jgi:hypothetical protein